jgi:IS605 OrfB family transposase
MNESKNFTYQARISSSEQQKQVLGACANLCGSVERHLFEDLNKNLPINSLKRSYLIEHRITARQFNACRVSVEGKISGAQECRAGQISQLKEKIGSLEKKILKIKNKKIRHHKNRSLISMRLRLEKLEQAHKEGPVSICFGGRKLFHAQYSLEENGYGSFEDWKKDWEFSRSSEFFCLGSKDETGGNQSCVLTLGENKLCHLRLRIPDSLAEIYGTKYLVLSNIAFNYGYEEIVRALSEKKALSYRFKQDEKGWRVFISFSQEKAFVVTREVLGGIGVDINADHLAGTEIDAKGNPIDKQTFPLCTYGKEAAQTKALIGDVCQSIVALAKEKQKPIVVENLDFSKKKATLKEESTPKLARMLSSLSYSHILENLERKAFKEGVGFFRVNPAMTSIIGKVKFAKRYGLSTHHAAALCIVRRFFKFSEAPSKCPMKVVHKNIQVTCPLPERNRRQHVWKFWIGANRKLKAALAALLRGSQGPLYSRP